MYICDIYQSSLKFYCQRFSNNATPIFTDQELLTVYLFCGAYQRYFQIKEIHTFTEEYLLSWFPNLPSYQTFNYRLNLMSEAISELVKHLITFFKPEDCDSMTSLIDSVQERIKQERQLLKLQPKDTVLQRTCITSVSNSMLQPSAGKELFHSRK